MKKFKTFTTLLFIFFISGCFADDKTIYISSGYQQRLIAAKQIKSSSVTKASNGFVAVKKGDTVYGLARKYNVSLRSVIDVNKLKPPYKLVVGQRLKIPESHYHIVKKGETVYSITRKYNVKMASLINANKLKAPYNINVGQKLLLPSFVVAQKAIKPPTKIAEKSVSKKAPTKITVAKNKAKPVSYVAPKRAGKLFKWPLQGKIITPYGQVGKGVHNDGINIAGKQNQNIVAAENGVVAYSGNELVGYGNLLLIKHAEGWVSAYAHNSSVLVRKGQKIKKGQVIAKVGQTGNVAFPQLHFELRKGSKPINPMKYLEKK